MAVAGVVCVEEAFGDGHEAVGFRHGGAVDHVGGDEVACGECGAAGAGGGEEICVCGLIEAVACRGARVAARSVGGVIRGDKGRAC